MNNYVTSISSRRIKKRKIEEIHPKKPEIVEDGRKENESEFDWRLR